MGFALKKAALVAACMAAFPAHATNGYFLPGFGFRSQGMGGVGIAYGRDSLSIAANPANIVNTGMRGDFGMGVFNPERYAASGTATAAGGASPFFFNYASESDAKYFIMPEMGATMPISDRVHAGVAFVGNGGMNTTYRTNLYTDPNLRFFFPPTSPPPPAGDTTLGVDMMQLLVPITVGYKVDDDHSVGVSLTLAETRFRAYGLGSFGLFDTLVPITADAGNMTNKGFDYSYGAGIRVGWQGEFLDDRVTLGLTYASKTYMTKFDKYAGLFAEQGDFDIPANFGIGIAIRPVRGLVVAADVQRIEFSDVRSVGNLGPGAILGIPGIPSASDSTKETGNDAGMGFGWKDQTVYKIGVNYGVNSRLQLRAGYNYGKSPIPDDQLTFGILTPATVEKHFSVGFTYKANDNLEVTGTYVYVAPNTQQACGLNIMNCVEIGMHQNVFGLSAGWILDPAPGAADEYGDREWAGINFDGWYGGFNFGQSKYKGVEEDSANTRTEGWKVYGGYQFNEYLALEGGYVNLNDMSAVTGTVRTHMDTDAWVLGAVGSFPLTKRLAVTGKVGAAYMLTDVDVKNGAALTQRGGDDGYEPNYGVGVKYALLDNLSVRAEWERFDRSDYDIDLMSAGLALKF